ncbi:MAG: hypothetical protein JNM99_16545 [Verrucomicrobiaceae bacterium]|nr:hypothetical protein [Verrucomicrobiaceae bacterium]
MTTRTAILGFSAALPVIFAIGWQFFDGGPRFELTATIPPRATPSTASGSPVAMSSGVAMGEQVVASIDHSGTSSQHTSPHMPGLIREMNDQERATMLREMMHQIRQGTAEQKQTLVTSLVAMDHADAFQALSDAFHQTKDAETRQLIAAALKGYVGMDREARELVTSLIALGGDAVLVDAASDAIARSADEDTIQHLQELLHDPTIPSGARERLMHTISTVATSAAAPALVRLLDGDQQDADLRAAAASGLASIGDESSLDALLHHATPSEAGSEQVQPVLKALREIRSPALRERLLATAQMAGDPLLRQSLEASVENITFAASSLYNPSQSAP